MSERCTSSTELYATCMVHDRNLDFSTPSSFLKYCMHDGRFSSKIRLLRLRVGIPYSYSYTVYRERRTDSQLVVIA